MRIENELRMSGTHVHVNRAALLGLFNRRATAGNLKFTLRTLLTRYRLGNKTSIFRIQIRTKLYDYFQNVVRAIFSVTRPKMKNLIM